jgi:large subunit ribosomal protein L4
MEVKVYRQDGTETGRTVSLDPSVFDVTPHDHAIWLDVKAIRANARQGTHKAKERAEVAGSTRKLYRQKGTGHARAGSAKSPIRRSGGTIFGPRPRDYSQDINRKTKRLARRSALTYKARNGNIRVVEDFVLEAPSTREMVGFLRAGVLQDRRVLLLTAEYDTTLYLSGRNIPGVRVLDAASASTYDIMQAAVLVVQEGALPVISSVLGKPAPVSQE